MRMQIFDAIVLGLATMGSSLAWSLPAVNCESPASMRSLLPIPAAAIPSTHSVDTRVLRVAYAERPDYVPRAHAQD
jgi:hypothetical protein